MTHPAESIGKGDGSRHRRARMLRYGVWQARDFLFERALGLLAIGGVFGYLNASERMAALHRSIATLPPALIAKWGGLAAATVMMRRDFNERFLTDLVPILVYLGAQRIGDIYQPCETRIVPPRRAHCRGGTHPFHDHRHLS